MLDLAIVSARRLLGDKRGISAIEYGVLGAVVVVAVAALATPLGTLFTDVFDSISSKVPA
jgi:Flp pilus assembly pilin Flp